MKQKMITIPFDVELAKKIQDGEHPGKITTRNERKTRVLCLDANCGFPIVGLVASDDGDECLQSWRNDGNYYGDGEEYGRDLVLQVPEWIQYKDGDILACEVDNGDGDYCKWYAILDGSIGFMLGHTYFGSYVSYDYDSAYKAGQLTYNESCDNIDSIRLITEEEKQKFINRLKEENTDQAKDILKHYFGIEEGEEKPKSEVKSEVKSRFEPYDRVLCRDTERGKWCPTIFSYYDPQRKHYPYVTVCGCFTYCIPYNEKTKHLAGTTDDWEEE